MAGALLGLSCFLMGPCLLYRALLAGVSELAWWAWGAVGT